MPSFLKKIWGKWKAFAEVFGAFMSGVVLTILYCTIVLPYGLFLRFFADPLSVKTLPNDSNWKPLPRKDSSLESCRKQY